MAKSLTMTFLNADGNRSSISVSNIKDSLTSGEVAEVMDTIIEKSIFTTSGGALMSKDSAQIVDKTTSSLSVR
jgi:hypothetical protein